MSRTMIMHMSIVAALIAGILGMTSLYLLETKGAEPHTVTIDGVVVTVRIADTVLSRAKGLSGTQELAAGEGMLFVFEEDGRYALWMKGMLFPIDMIWIRADGTIVHIASSISPETYPTAFMPPTPARYVLEVGAGFAAEHGIEVGSKVTF